MPNFIVITERRESPFSREAQTVLESGRYAHIGAGTFTGSGSTSSLVTQLKALESYKKARSSNGTEIFHGSLSRA